MKTTRKSTQKSRVHKDYLIPDALWNEIQPLLPKHVTHHPLGCHRKRVDDRSAMNAIFFVLKTGCQWNALNATGICSSSSAHRRFQEWNEAGVFRRRDRRAEGGVEEPAIAGRRPGEAGDASRRKVIVGAVSHRVVVQRCGRRTNR